MGALGNMVEEKVIRVAGIVSGSIIAEVYLQDYFNENKLYERTDVLWVIDENYEAFVGGAYIEGKFISPEPCSDCYHPVEE